MQLITILNVAYNYGPRIQNVVWMRIDHNRIIKLLTPNGVYIGTQGTSYVDKNIMCYILTREKCDYVSLMFLNMF